EAAWGIHRVVNESMASAFRIHAIERGRDVRGYALFAFGGAGPVHACAVADILGLDQVVCPAGAGTASAFGMLCAPLAFDFRRTYRASLANLDWDHVNQLLMGMIDEGRATLESGGVAPEDIRVRCFADMRHEGQTFEI